MGKTRNGKYIYSSDLMLKRLVWGKIKGEICEKFARNAILIRNFSKEAHYFAYHFRGKKDGS